MKVYISIVSLASKLNINRVITFPFLNIKIQNKILYIVMYVLMFKFGKQIIDMYILVVDFGK